MKLEIISQHNHSLQARILANGRVSRLKARLGAFQSVVVHLRTTPQLLKGRIVCQQTRRKNWTKVKMYRHITDSARQARQTKRERALFSQQAISRILKPIMWSTEVLLSLITRIHRWWRISIHAEKVAKGIKRRVSQNRVDQTACNWPFLMKDTCSNP